MAPAAEKERILVVDDAPDTLELIQRNLAAGHIPLQLCGPQRGCSEVTRLAETGIDRSESMLDDSIRS